MNLDQLQLNRRLYKKNNKTDSTDPTDNITLATSGSGGSSSSTSTPPPATAIAPGTLIQSCIWQTSASDYRVELTPDDKLSAYENGSVRARINRDGIVTFDNGLDRTVRMYEDGLDVYDLGTNDVFVEVDSSAGIFDVYDLNTGDPVLEIDGNDGYAIYGNSILPMVYGGSFDVGTGTGVVPPGWTATLNGFDVDFTYPNTSTPLYVTVSPINAHFRAMITNVSAGAFTVSMQQSTYAGGTYSVTGGGGGSVTIGSGIYQGENNNTLSSFYFTAVQYIV